MILEVTPSRPSKSTHRISAVILFIRTGVGIRRSVGKSSMSGIQIWTTSTIFSSVTYGAPPDPDRRSRLRHLWPRVRARSRLQSDGRRNCARPSRPYRRPQHRRSPVRRRPRYSALGRRRPSNRHSTALPRSGADKRREDNAHQNGRDENPERVDPNGVHRQIVRRIDMSKLRRLPREKEVPRLFSPIDDFSTGQN